MTQHGLIISTTSAYATVRVTQHSACGENCAACGGCTPTTREATVHNPIGAKIGDRVKIELPSSRIYLAAFLLYILPILILIPLLIAQTPLYLILPIFIAYFTILHICDKKITSNGRVTQILR